MNWHTDSIVLVTILSGSIALLATLWLEIPTHWYPSYFVGAPVVGCLLTSLTQATWAIAQERKRRRMAPEQSEQFISSVRHIDQQWHQSFESVAKFLQEGIDLFRQINKELYESVGDTVKDHNWRYKVVVEMTVDSLRIMDSVISQLRSGHPDTALATTRQIFELAMFQKVVSLDPTGETARRYQDFSEIRYLQDLIETDRPDKAEHERRLRMIKDQYPLDTKFRSTFAWMKLESASGPNSMKDVIEYLVDRVYADPVERKRVLTFHLQQWVNLNSWTHISKSASRRKLAIRTGECYAQIHLLAKADTGLETPLSMSTFYLKDTLVTLENTAYTLTQKSHSDSLEQIMSAINEIGTALDSVPPELLANDFRIRGRAIKEHTEENAEGTTNDDPSRKSAADARLGGD